MDSLCRSKVRLSNGFKWVRSIYKLKANDERMFVNYLYFSLSKELKKFIRSYCNVSGPVLPTPLGAICQFQFKVLHVCKFN